MSDITNLDDRKVILMRIYTWQILIESILRGLLSLYVLFVVLV